MAIHPSLRLTDKNKRQRSVLKRTERLKAMMEKGAWKENDDVFGLPKLKTLRIKIKKEKAEKAAETTTAEGAAAVPAAGAAKEQAAPKAGAAKTQEKK